jgi:hypothetical protein
VTDQPLSQTYLFVSPEGEIIADGRKRTDRPEGETWRCEYFERFFRVAMVHPKETETQIIRIENDTYKDLKRRGDECRNRKLQNARHEAGHAILCYALRVATVEEMDLRPSASPRGNLYDQLKRQVASRPAFIGATTYPVFSDADQQAKETRFALGIACQGFGGLVGSRGDQTGVEGDLTKIRQILPSLLSSARRGVFASNDLGQLATAPSLENRLKSLAEEIMSDPVIASRHEALAKQLAEREQLNQQEIEAIIDPATLPDYSSRLEEIRREFQLNEKY